MRDGGCAARHALILSAAMNLLFAQSSWAKRRICCSASSYRRIGQW